jgi:enterochelin esterase-like enzyme
MTTPFPRTFYVANAIERFERMAITRRSFLGIAAALVATRAKADVPKAGATADLEFRDIRVDGDLSRRFVLCVPTHLAKHERVPLLVLLHGLNETQEERMGAFAWVERYGLGTAYERLRHAPVARTSSSQLWTDERVAEINAELSKRPFRGLVIACPYMPDLQISSPSELDRYAKWITEVVIPRAHKEAPTLTDAKYTGLDGCSLGGHFGLEVFLRRPEAFGAWGGVQTAIAEASAAEYARRLSDVLAKVGPRDIHLETSTNDAFRKGNEALTASLAKRGVAHDFRMISGPHDQAWLRESGTPEMLLWHDQRPRPSLRIAR